MFNRLFNLSRLEPFFLIFFCATLPHLHCKIKPGHMQNVIRARAHQTAPIQCRPFATAKIQKNTRKIAVIGVFVFRCRFRKDYALHVLRVLFQTSCALRVNRISQSLSVFHFTDPATFIFSLFFPLLIPSFGRADVDANAMCLFLSGA